MVSYDVDASLPTQLHLTRHANPVTDVDLEPSAAHRFASVERTDWRPEVRTCSPAHCCRHQAVASRCAEYILSTGRHMLPDVTEIGRQGSMPSLLTESWQVMTEPTGSQPSNETNADRDASLLETVVWHCSTRAARHDDRQITEKFAIKQAQPEVLYGEENPVDEVVALLASTTVAAADHSQDWLPSKPYFA